jgi:hypothetical protein
MQTIGAGFGICKVLLARDGVSFAFDNESNWFLDRINIDDTEILAKF